MSLKEELKDWLEGLERLVVMGVGNPLRKDDAVGVYVAKKLVSGKLPANVKVIVCEGAPENFLNEALDFKPSHILVVDAVMLERECGLIRVEELQKYPPISTHRIPLSLLFHYARLRGFRGEGAVLGIRPASLEFGEGLTEGVKKVADGVVRVLLSLLKGE